MAVQLADRPSPPPVPRPTPTPPPPPPPGIPDLKYKTWGDVPGGERNLLTDLAHQFGFLVGFTINFSNTRLLLEMANGRVGSVRDMGMFIAAHQPQGIKLDNYPWAKYGLDKEQYASTSTIYSTEYKKITGQDISAAALTTAFKNPDEALGGLMTGSQYANQLMQDANIQKTFGWVKYGMDFSQWQQQKLSMRTSLGRDISDSEAGALLQYNTQARGASQTAIARVPQQQPSVGAAGVGQSLVR